VTLDVKIVTTTKRECVVVGGHEFDVEEYLFTITRDREFRVTHVDARTIAYRGDVGSWGEAREIEMLFNGANVYIHLQPGVGTEIDEWIVREEWKQ